MTTSPPETGLLVISEAAQKPAGAVEYDIVAVHGLNGDRIQSWTFVDPDAKSKIVWLRHILPSQMPAARVMSFGWTLDDDETTPGSITAKGVKAKALELLDAICQVRVASIELRPLLLLGQDIGGTIIKQALLIAKDNDKYRSVAANTFRLVFLGTPHRAIHPHAWEVVAFKIVFASSTQPMLAETLSTVIKASAKTLIDVSEGFDMIAGNYDVASFHKGKDSARPLGLAIDVYSATLDLPSEEVVALKGSHETMCHFSLEGSEELDRVFEKLKYSSGPEAQFTSFVQKASKMLSGATKLPTLQWHTYKEFLQILSRLSSGAVRSIPSHWHPRTLTWVLSQGDYLKWLHGNEAPFLVVYGQSGSGKSVLANFLLNALRSSLGRKRALIHFSFDAGDVRRSSVRGMLVSLVHQLLSFQPLFFYFLQLLCDEWVHQRSPWTGEALWILFRTIVTCPIQPGIICIIDGADKCDSTLQAFLDDVMALSDAMAVSQFKMIITSRAVLGLTDPYVINLGEQPENRGDIRKVVQSALSDLVRERPAFVEFEEKIKATSFKSDTTFLRATLSLNYLRHVSLKSTPASISKALGPIGCGPHEIYEHILQNIPRHLSLWAWKALLWILYAFRPLTTQELATALAIQADTATYTSVDSYVSRDISTDLDHAFSGLIRIKHNEVHLVHHSAREYLLARVAKGDQGTIPDQPHGILARRCLTYLCMRELTDDPLTIDYSSDEPEIRLPCMRKYGLLAYAVKYWPGHYRLADRSSVFSGLVIRLLEDKTQMHMWSELYWCLTDSAPRPDKSLAYSLPIAAQLGLTDIVELLLDGNGAVDVTTIDGGLALEVAAENGHANVVGYLLAAGVSDKTAIKRGLRLAARNGFLEVLKQLLELDDSLAAVDSVQSTPFHFACLSGHLGMVKELLGKMRYAPHACNPTDLTKSTPLHLAAQSGCVAVVQELLSAGASVNTTDCEKMTPLHLAAQRAHVIIVQVLLEAKADVAMVDGNGFTPLHLAAQGGYLTVVKQLVKAGADLTAVDDIKNTPLHFAALGGHVQIIVELLEHGAPPNAINEDGDTPLHLLGASGCVAAVTELIRGGAFVNATNNSQVTPLCVAARSGHEAIVQALLEARADMSLTDKEESTPLHLAAMNGFVNVVRKLIDAKALVTAVNHDEATPLYLAASVGHADVVKELLKAGAAPHAACVGESTPLHAAAKGGHLSVVQILLEQAEVNPDEKDHDDRTPLSMAAEGGFSEVMQLLLQRDGVGPASRDKQDITPLYWAAKLGHVECVKLLIERSISTDINSKNGTSGQTPLFVAAQEGHEAVVRLFLEEEGVDPEVENELKRTASIIACFYGHTGVVKQLLNRDDINWNHRDISGLTPIMAAASKKHEDVVAMLLENDDIKLNTVDKNDQTPLICAASSGYTEVLKLLLKRADVDLEAKETTGRTALLMAAFNGHLEIVQILIERDSTLLDTKDNKGLTPLGAAAYNGYLDLVRYLLQQKDVDPDGLDIFGRTPLYWAAYHGWKDIVEELLKCSGVDINHEDLYSWKPLNIAITNGHKDVVRLLLQQDGIEADAPESPIYSAVIAGSQPVLELLLERGVQTVTGKEQYYECFRFVAYGGDSTLMQLLIEHSPNDIALSEMCVEALQLACLKGNRDIVDKLLDAGVDPNAVDSHGWTGSMCAVHSKNTEILERLGLPIDDEESRPPRELEGLTPSRFSESDKFRRLRFSEDALCVTYAADDSDSAVKPVIVHANHPIPLNAFPYYFELTIPADSNPSSPIIIGIGLFHAHLPRISFPGWLPGSWAYHGDDGKVYDGEVYSKKGTGAEYAETFGAGDVVGCLVSKEGDVKFTKNGVLLHVAAEGVKGKLVPAVGLHTAGATARVNFGPRGFRYQVQQGEEGFVEDDGREG